MKYFNEYKINGMPLLVPDADVALTQTDLDAGSAERDEAGFMHRIRVRKRVKNWAFQYFVLTQRELQYLEDLLSQNEVFNFTYLAPNGEQKSCRAYCSSTGLSYHNAKLRLYRNYKFTVTEC